MEINKKIRIKLGTVIAFASSFSILFFQKEYYVHLIQLQLMTPVE